MRLDNLALGDQVVLRDLNCREVQHLITFRNRGSFQSELSLSTIGTILRQCSNPEWFVLKVDGLLGAVHVGSVKPWVTE